MNHDYSDQSTLTDGAPPVYVTAGQRLAFLMVGAICGAACAFYLEEITMETRFKAWEAKKITQAGEMAVATASTAWKAAKQKFSDMKSKHATPKTTQ